MLYVYRCYVHIQYMCKKIVHSYTVVYSRIFDFVAKLIVGKQTHSMNCTVLYILPPLPLNIVICNNRKTRKNG